MVILAKYSLYGETFKFRSFEDIEDYDKVVCLNCSHNYLVSLPPLPNILEYLDCSHNTLVSLPSLPITLNTLYCVKNKLVSLPQGPNGLPISLKALDCSYNKLVSLPISLLNCRNLTYLYFKDNEIEYIPPVLTRFIARIRDTSGRDLKVYSDTQSVHNVRIQECARKSILSVLESEVHAEGRRETVNKDKAESISSETIIEEILKDEILTKETKESLVEYSKDLEIHSTLNISFLDFLVPVWKRIKSHSDSQEMKKILNTEMSDSICMCFTGRLTRLLNVLNGYYPDVQIEISENDQIANIIYLTKQSLFESSTSYNLEAHKDLVRKEMLERDYPLETIETWVSAIEE